MQAGEKILENYESIINGPSYIGVFDCDSTVIASKISDTGKIITTGEGLSDVALALGRRIGNPHIALEVDEIAQKTMSSPGAVFQDSLNARFEILQKYGLEKQDVQLGAEEAVFSPGFSEYIQLRNWLKEQQDLPYQPYFFLSGGFREMLEKCLSGVVECTFLSKILFSNEFLYRGSIVTGFDPITSLMYLEGAKKTMVDRLKSQGNIPKGISVSGVGDGSNDISMSDTGLFIAYTGVKRREKVVEIAGGVEAVNFFEVALFHTSPEERKIVYASGNRELIGVLEEGKRSLRDRVRGLDFF